MTTSLTENAHNIHHSISGNAAHKNIEAEHKTDRKSIKPCIQSHSTKDPEHHRLK